jgi:ADP-heptose:LPS heptosyltransferase
MRLENYLPDLKTDYHYELSLPRITRKWYYPRLKSAHWVGISAASYRGANAWKTWGTGEWSKLIKMLLRRGYNIALLGGSWDDLTKQLLYTLKVGDRILNLIGETTFGEVCSVQKMLKFYIGFCSGLGIVRTVLGLPTIMLWPEHMQFLRTSWADPGDVKSYKYIDSGYLSPKEVFSTFKVQEKFYG